MAQFVAFPDAFNYLSYYFADSANTQPLFGITPKGCTPPTEVTQQATSTACPARYTVLGVGTAFSGTTIYIGTTGYPASKYSASYDILHNDGVPLRRRRSKTRRRWSK